jgi:hypothetical protein
MQRHSLDVYPESGVGRHIRERLLCGRNDLVITGSISYNLGSLASGDRITRAESVVAIARDDTLAGQALYIGVERAARQYVDERDGARCGCCC